MKPINFIVEVHCLYLEPNSRYRLYADNDLLVERTWRWGLNVLIEEDIWLDLKFGVEHNIMIEPLCIHKSAPPFIFKNFKILHKPINIISVTDLAVRFII